jgi:hypothetical protein
MEPEKTKRTFTDEEGRTFVIVEEGPWAVCMAIVSICYLLAVLVWLFRELFFVWSGYHHGFPPFLVGRDPNASRVDQPTFRLVSYVVIGGAMGSVVNGIRSFLSWHCDARGFGPRYIWKYVTLPFLGATLALIVFALVRGGIAALGGEVSLAAPSPGHGFIALGIGVLSGYGARDVFVWLNIQVSKLFSTNLIVPTVAGQNAEQAKQTLERAGFALGSAATRTTGDLKMVGLVLSQDPAAGQQAPSRSAVAITLGGKD